MRSLCCKRFLLIDLDAQSNSSLILTGNAQWIEAQKSFRKIAAYIEDRMYGPNPIGDYVLRTVGDIEKDNGEPIAIDLLPGSLQFEDMRGELISHYSRHNTPFRQAKARCAEHFRRALHLANPLADLIVLDCAPGISNATQAALRLAEQVIVPFRPDSVSEFAVDKISMIIEGKDPEALVATPHNERRYRCLANYVRTGGQDQVFIETLAADHPTLATQMPMYADLANAFFGRPNASPLRKSTAPLSSR